VQLLADSLEVSALNWAVDDESFCNTLDWGLEAKTLTLLAWTYKVISHLSLIIKRKTHSQSIIKTKTGARNKDARMGFVNEGDVVWLKWLLHYGHWLLTSLSRNNNSAIFCAKRKLFSKSPWSVHAFSDHSWAQRRNGNSLNRRYCLVGKHLVIITRVEDVPIGSGLTMPETVRAEQAWSWKKCSALDISSESKFLQLLFFFFLRPHIWTEVHIFCQVILWIFALMVGSAVERALEKKIKSKCCVHQAGFSHEVNFSDRWVMLLSWNGWCWGLNQG